MDGVAGRRPVADAGLRQYPGHAGADGKSRADGKVGSQVIENKQGLIIHSDSSGHDDNLDQVAIELELLDHHEPSDAEPDEAEQVRVDVSRAVHAAGGHAAVARQLQAAGATPGLVKKCLILAYELGSAAFATGVSFGVVGGAKAAFTASLLKLANADRRPDEQIQYGDPAYHAIEAFGSAVFAIGGTALIGALNGAGGALAGTLRGLLHKCLPGGLPKIDSKRAVAQGDALIATFVLGSAGRQAYETHQAVSALRSGVSLPPSGALDSFSSLRAATPTLATVTAVAMALAFAARRDGGLRYDDNAGYSVAAGRRLIVARLQSAHQIGLTGRLPLLPVPVALAQTLLPVLVGALVAAGVHPSVVAGAAGVGQGAIFWTLLDVWGTQNRRNDGVAALDDQLAHANIDRATRAQLLMERDAAVQNHVAAHDPYPMVERLVVEGFRNASAAAISGALTLSALERPMAVPERETTDFLNSPWQNTVLAAVTALVAMAVVQRLANTLVGDAGQPYQPVAGARGGPADTFPAGDPRLHPSRARSAGAGVLAGAMGGAAAVVGGHAAGVALTGSSLALAALAGVATYSMFASVSPLVPRNDAFQLPEQPDDDVAAARIAEEALREVADPEARRPRGLVEQLGYYASVFAGGVEVAQQHRARVEVMPDEPPLAIAEGEEVVAGGPARQREENPQSS